MGDRRANGGVSPLTERLMIEPDQARMETMTFARFVEIPPKRSPGYCEKAKDWITASHATDMMRASSILDAQVTFESDPKLSQDMRFLVKNGAQQTGVCFYETAGDPAMRGLSGRAAYSVPGELA